MARNYPRRERTGSVWSVVVVFIILGVLSLVAGYLGGQYLLQGITGQADGPPSQPDTGDDDEEVPHDADEILQWPGISVDVYRIQVGAFTEPSGAKAKADMIREEGASAAVIAGDDYHRVVVDITDTREAAEYIADHMTIEDREAAAISWSVSVPGKEMQVPADWKDEISEMLHCLDELIQAQAESPVVAADTAVTGEVVESAERFSELWDEAGGFVEVACEDLHALIAGYVVPNVRGLQQDSRSMSTRQSFIELLGALSGEGDG